MAGKSIHLGYTGINDSIMTSEVLAAKYANEVAKAGYEGDKEDIISHMEQLDGILKESGVVIPNDVLEVFAEITVYLGNQGRTDLMGKVPTAICKLHKSSIQDQTRSITYVEKLKSLTEQLSEQVSDLKRTSITMKATLPRLKIKAKRSLKTINDEKNPASKSVQNEKRHTPGEVQMAEASDSPPEVTTDQQSSSQFISPNLDPQSDTARRMRDNYRQYYSFDGFSTLSHDKQVAIIEYYMTHILRVTMEEYEDDSEVYNMFSDLIDKERMMAHCKLAEDDELTVEMIDDAICYMVDIINACSSAYGKYSAEIKDKNDMSILYIRSFD